MGLEPVKVSYEQAMDGISKLSENKKVLKDSYESVHQKTSDRTIKHKAKLPPIWMTVFLVYKDRSFLEKKSFCDNGREMRKLHDRLKRLEPECDLKLHLLYNERMDDSVWHDRKKYYTDMETGQKWIWTYKTDSVYSREDGWWYEEPKVLL